MTTSSPCQQHMGASPHTPEVLRIEAKWMGEKREDPAPGGSQASIHSAPTSRSGRSPALPYPPGWHGKNKEAFETWRDERKIRGKSVNEIEWLSREL